MNLEKIKRFRSKKILNSAKDEQCQIRLTGCFVEPVCAAHLGGAGMGLKESDIFISYACNICHQKIDGNIKSSLTKDELRLAFFDGMVRTQKILLKQELMKI